VRLRCAIEHSSLVAGIAIAATLITSNAYGQTINAVSCSPSTIAGGSGDSATCTVTLTSAAPAGGTPVALTSSLMELAALLPRVIVPAGQTQGTFTVTTNANYRAYSGIGFSAAIGASANGSSRSTTINVTAQPRPADFTSGSQASANTQWDGLMCGGIAPIGGRAGILYSCSPAQGTGFGICTFQQECNLGCRRVPPNGTTFSDFCATAGPNAVSISRNVIIAGDRVPSSIVAEAPAGQAQDREQGAPGTIDPAFNSSYFPHAGSISFPDGATSVPFEVGTSYTPGIQFVDVVGFWFNASIPPFLITNGRAGHQWLVMLPPDPPPAIATPTLGDFQITGFNPITGGNSTIGQIDLSGLSRVGGPTFTVTSSNRAVVPTQSFSAPANQSLFGFQASIQTKPTSTDTEVTLTATDGRYSFSRALTVRASPPPPVLADVVVDPTSVVGGSSAIGTVMLSAPQSGSTTVALSTPAPTSVARMPASVTIPAGATSASFTVITFPVTSQFNMNIFADLPGNPGQQALLLITPGGSAAASSMAIAPTGLVGGSGATGSITLSAAAPSGGAVVTLSKALSNGGAGTVPATIPASVTVPAGQRTASFAIGTSAVTSTTNVRISGVFGGATAAADVTVFPLLAQVMFSGNVPGGTPAAGTVTLNGAAPSGGTVVSLSSANPSLVTVPPSVTIPAGQTSVNFTANTSTVTQTTSVNVSATAAGTTVTGTVFLVVSSAVSSVTLNPSTVTGGVTSTATVTLNSAAVGQVFVALASSNTVLATVPNGVTIPSGQRSATFSVNTAQVTSTSSVSISATFENVTRSATLTLNPSGSTPPPSGQTATLTVSASGRTGERVLSSPSGINVSVGSTGSATFTIGTTITLSVSNGRDAIWSGACSSGGNKTRTCSFKLAGPASVSANVR
jgi:trimeric autotransporter adhesin